MDCLVPLFEVLNHVKLVYHNNKQKIIMVEAGLTQGHRKNFWDGNNILYLKVALANSGLLFSCINY